MKLGELRTNGKIKATWETGFYTVKIESIKVLTDKVTDDITFFVLEFKDYEDILLKFFDNGANYQLNNLCKMLEINNYADLLNVHNEMISFQMVPNGEYLNPRFTTKEISVKPIIE